MCYQYTDTDHVGISSHAQSFENSETLGQCSRCLINIPHKHLCGVFEGKLVCYAHVRSHNAEHKKHLIEYKYGQEVLGLLAEYNNEKQCV